MAERVIPKLDDGTVVVNDKKVSIEEFFVMSEEAQRQKGVSLVEVSPGVFKKVLRD